MLNRTQSRTGSQLGLFVMVFAPIGLCFTLLSPVGDPSAQAATAQPAPGNGATVAEVASAIAAPRRCPAPGAVLTQSSAGAGTVALTFDDGPGVETPEILRILAENNVRATFFMVGEQVRTNPRTAASVAAAGHAIGEHTDTHANLTHLDPAGQDAELAAASSSIVATTGITPCVMRPPYGAYTATTSAIALGRSQAVALWDVDTRDWRAGTQLNQTVIDSAMATVQSAYSATPAATPIVLMHDGPGPRPSTAALLPQVIDFYRSRGYTFVTLEQ